MGEAPIIFWVEMKLRLREKYLPAYYRSQLFDQCYNLKQSILGITEYQSKFENCLLGVHYKKNRGLFGSALMDLGLKSNVRLIFTLLKL